MRAPLLLIYLFQPALLLAQLADTCVRDKSARYEYKLPTVFQADEKDFQKATHRVYANSIIAVQVLK